MKKSIILSIIFLANLIMAAGISTYRTVFTTTYIGDFAQLFVKVAKYNIKNIDIV